MSALTTPIAVSRSQTRPWAIVALPLALVGLAALQGCTSILTPLGENHYDCNRKENPQSPYCHSFKSVEASTAGPIPRSRYDETLRISEIDRLTGIAPTAPGGGLGNVPAASGATVSAVPPMAPAMASAQSLEGVPVRLGPVVQRVWIKRFVDTNDLLVGDTVIYKEIMGSRWSGFEAADPMRQAPSRAAGGQSSTYPHRAPTAINGVIKALDGSSPSSANPSPQTRDAAGRPARPEFNQPGAKASEPAELVPVPATESGTTSMPQ